MEPELPHLKLTGADSCVLSHAVKYLYFVVAACVYVITLNRFILHII